MNGTQIIDQDFASTTLIHNLDNKENSLVKKKFFLATVVIVLGIISGYVLARSFALPVKDSTTFQPAFNGKKIVVGSADTKTFRDSTEGLLEVGGINGEGTHKLIRPGGESQTVYLTSSVLNLNDFVGKKVKVWGETFSAKKAGWFMDVGKIEVIQ